MPLIRSLPSRSYAGKAKITDEFLHLDFKGEDLEDVTELDYDNLVKSIQSGKLIKIINLVVDDKVFNGIANATYDETNELVEFVVNNYNVKVESDGSTTYEASGESDFYTLEITLDAALSESDGAKVTEVLSQDKPIYIISPTYYDDDREEWRDDNGGIQGFAYKQGRDLILTALISSSSKVCSYVISPTEVVVL